MIVARSVLRVPLSALAMAYPPTNRVSARETDYLLACRFLISRRESRCLSWRPVGKKEEEEEKNLLSPVSPSSLQNGSSLSLLDWFRSWIGDVRDVCTTSNSLLHLRLEYLAESILPLLERRRRWENEFYAWLRRLIGTAFVLVVVQFRRRMKLY